MKNRLSAGPSPLITLKSLNRECTLALGMALAFHRSTIPISSPSNYSSPRRRPRSPRASEKDPLASGSKATTEAPAAKLLGHRSTPSESVARVELQLRLQEALNSLGPLDREVLTLRHFEQLSNAEAAREMGVGEAAASKRYLRALYKLKGVLTRLNLDGAL